MHIQEFLVSRGFKTQIQRAEQADFEDCKKGDLLIFASGTWNTGNREGQLGPSMNEFVHKKAKNLELGGKKVAVIGLGDERYRYTCKAADHLEEFVESHGGTLVSTLRIVNEPYGQEETIEEWCEGLISHLPKYA